MTAPFQRFRPGPLTREQAAELDRLAYEVSRLINTNVVPPLRRVPNAGSYSMFVDESNESPEIFSDASGSGVCEASAFPVVSGPLHGEAVAYGVCEGYALALPSGPLHGEAFAYGVCEGYAVPDSTGPLHGEAFAYGVCEAMAFQMVSGPLHGEAFAYGVCEAMAQSPPMPIEKHYQTPAITTDQHNYALPYYDVCKIIFDVTNSAGVDLTGLSDPTYTNLTGLQGTFPGRYIELVNSANSTGPMTIKNLDSGSHSLNQFQTQDGNDNTLMPGNRAKFEYLPDTKTYQQVEKTSSNSKGCDQVKCIQVSQCVDIQQSTQSGTPDKDCLYRNTSNQLAGYDNASNPVVLSNTYTGGGTPPSSGANPGDKFIPTNGGGGTTGTPYTSYPTDDPGSSLPYVWLPDSSANKIYSNGNQTITLTCNEGPTLGGLYTASQTVLDWAAYAQYNGFLSIELVSETGTIFPQVACAGPNAAGPPNDYGAVFNSLSIGTAERRDASTLTNPASFSPSTFQIVASASGGNGATATLKIIWNLAGNPPVGLTGFF